MTLKAIQTLSNKAYTKSVRQLLPNAKATFTVGNSTHVDEEEGHQSSIISKQNTTNDEQEMEAASPICLEVYKVGDDVCFSRNAECPHEFHLDCMLDWLMRKCHDGCPLCRVDYLKVFKEELV